MFSTFPYFPKDHRSSLTLFVEDSFINDHLCLGEDSDEHGHGEEYDDESCESYIEDDEEWLSDFMEDPFYESRQNSDEEAAEILGLPSKGIKCDGENICGICLDPLEKCDGDMKELPCKHMYHYSCILESTKIKNTCPMCRGEYDFRENDYCGKEIKNSYSFFNDHLYLGEDDDEHDYGFRHFRYRYLFDSYTDYDEWMSDFMEDPFYDSRKYSGEEGEETLVKKGDGENVSGICPDLSKCYEEMKHHLYFPLDWISTSSLRRLIRKIKELQRPRMNGASKGIIHANSHPHIFFEDHDSPICWDLESYFFERELKEAFAIFDDHAEASGSLGKRKFFDPKIVYCICHMKPLPCKEIYDYRAILGSTKIKSMGNMCAGRNVMKNKLEDSLQITQAHYIAIFCIITCGCAVIVGNNKLRLYSHFR